MAYTSDEYIKAIKQLRPNSQYNFDGNALIITNWLDTSSVQPTDAEIQTILPSIVSAETAEVSRQANLLADTQRNTLLAQLLSATPAQIDNYVANNVTTLAQAKTAIGGILKLLALSLRQ